MAKEIVLIILPWTLLILGIALAATGARMCYFLFTYQAEDPLGASFLFVFGGAGLIFLGLTSLLR